MQNILNILKELIHFPSITPQDAECQEYLMHLLEKSGFTCRRLNKNPVSNFLATKGQGSPFLLFAGHTDVVPPGNENAWNSDPFTLTQKGDQLYGRGVADMKGSIASMMVTAEKFTRLHPDFSGTLGFLITSGEEGNDYPHGTPYVMDIMNQEGLLPNYCIVGEPSSSKTVGDVLKIGRRGSLTGKIKLTGKQGHVAYPHLAKNAIHLVTEALQELTTTLWDEGNDHFPATTFQITHIHAGGQADNIIPGELILDFNFRYSTEQTSASLKQAIENIFKKYQLEPHIQWILCGEPFLTNKGKLLETCKTVIKNIQGFEPELSTCGGTSDGRFIAPYGVEVIELGPVGTTIHQVNECVSLKDLEILQEMYFKICEGLLQ